ncbi:hypothetical protein [Fodinibius salsisoli]|uniref:Uncharacterized protein n=1 Tax=Fodinibius salsisoli TaxID=2820877 RepID=A0ABT3PIG5_9BACT|nr:hypothetical protein [Fodinibius salsisoli]MCW9705721.1 hypothetical protein [Fodinibius salsisoli]
MGNEEVTKDKKSDSRLSIEGTHILDRELATLQFSVWDIARQKGHTKFVGSVPETAEFLERQDLDNLEVSALDLEYMHSLQPVSAEQWISWYYQTALSKLEDNNFDNGVLVPYPAK